MVGEQASLILQEFVLAMEHGLTLDDLAATIHTYPTYAGMAQSSRTSSRPRDMRGASCRRPSSGSSDSISPDPSRKTGLSTSVPKVSQVWRPADTRTTTGTKSSG